MNRFSVLLFLLLSLTGISLAEEEAPKAATTPWAGRYRLTITEDRSWHQNAFVLTDYTADEITGVLEIDLSIGPEQREPNADEKVHKIPVKGKRDNGNVGFVFETQIGSVQPVLYRMEIFPLGDADKSFCGTLSIGNRKCGVFLHREGDS